MVLDLVKCIEAMPELGDLQIHVNGQETFFLSEKILVKFSDKLRKIIKHEKRRTQIRNSGIQIDDFPGGPDGFELVSRFCYNDGTISITVSNVSLLHCCAIFLGMTEKMSSHNLLQQTEMFLEAIFYWSWNDILTCLKSCESFFSFADSCGLLQKLMCALLAKIAQNSDIGLLASTSSSSSSPETSRLRFSSPNKSYSSSGNHWWFEDLTPLSPKMIDHFVKTLGSYGSDNNSLVLTKFLLQYLKTAVQRKGDINPRSDYSALADTAVHGVISMGKTSFNCRGLFWVLRVVSGFGLSRECRAGLEKLIAGMLDQATLDDLLVSGRDGGVYDVNLVIRLIRLFVHQDKVTLQKLKKVGRLTEKYLREIAPDQSLKISKFLGVAESLPDCSRDCFDGIYRAIDIYLESHPSISLEERSRLCRCLNYEKLSLEACKDLAKNPRIPPRIAVKALASQNSSTIPSSEELLHQYSSKSSNQIVLYNNSDQDHFQVKNEDIKLNIKKMQRRVVELEKVCQDMKGQMSRMVKGRVMIAPAHSRTLPRMC